MPHYFFNLTDGRRALSDDKGVDLPEEMTIRDYARYVARDLMTKRRDGISDWKLWRVVVANEAGRPVMVVPFRDAVS